MTWGVTPMDWKPPTWIIMVYTLLEFCMSNGISDNSEVVTFLEYQWKRRMSKEYVWFHLAKNRGFTNTNYGVTIICRYDWMGYRDELQNTNLIRCIKSSKIGLGFRNIKLVGGIPTPLVVYLPLWKIWGRQLGWLFLTYGKIKNVETTNRI
jgi:hypothetical protein